MNTFYIIAKIRKQHQIDVAPKALSLLTQMKPYQKEQILTELIFHTSRSGGKGGQHVNKVSTKVEARLHIHKSSALSDEEKSSLIKKLGSKITDEGDLFVISQATRSQLKNKEKAIEKIIELIEKALAPKKKRIAVTISEGEKRKRLESKRQRSEKKKLRSKSGFNSESEK